MDRASHGPCYTCRSRRIQCDQSSVPCAKCQKAGLECFDKRPFRWVKGVAIRGKMQGRSYENADEAMAATPDSAASSPGPGPARSRRALVRSPGVQRPGSQSPPFQLNGGLPSMSTGMPYNLQDPFTLGLDPISKYYVDYYNEQICKLFIVYDSDKNPFRSLIPLGLSNPVLLKALVALAARHHANTGQSFYQPETPSSPRLIKADRDALAFKHQAMEALSHSLRDAKLSKQDTTVASIFLLIFLDLLESGSDGWNYHLEGVKNLIASIYTQSDSDAVVNQGPGQTIQEIRGFITKQIHFIETLGATFLRPKLLSQFSSTDTPDLQAQETLEQSFLGCPQYFLTAVQCLSMQRDTIAGSRPLDPAAIQSHSKEITSVIGLIQNFDCYAWATNLGRSRVPLLQDTANLCTLSQAYKLGALLYGKRILEAVTGEATVQDEMVTELLGMVDLLKDDPATFKCLLWPMFVAGMESQWPAQRNFLIACMERFWNMTKCLNVVNAAKALQDYWQQENSQGENRAEWIFNIDRAGRDSLWL